MVPLTAGAESQNSFAQMMIAYGDMQHVESQATAAEDHHGHHNHLAWTENLQLNIQSKEYNTEPKQGEPMGLHSRDGLINQLISPCEEEKVQSNLLATNGFRGRKLSKARANGIKVIQGDKSVWPTQQFTKKSDFQSGYHSLEQSQQQPGNKKSTQVLPSMSKGKREIQNAMQQRQTHAKNMSTVKLSIEGDGPYIQQFDSPPTLRIRDKQNHNGFGSSQQVLSHQQSMMMEREQKQSHLDNKRPMPLQSKYLRHDEGSKQDLSSAVPQSGSLKSPRPHWPSDDIFMRRVNNPKTGGNVSQESMQMTTYGGNSQSQHQTVSGSASGGVPIRMKGKFQPVLQKRSLERILFDDNYNRYMHAQTGGQKDMQLQQQKDRPLPLKQSKTPLERSNAAAKIKSASLDPRGIIQPSRKPNSGL